MTEAMAVNEGKPDIGLWLAAAIIGSWLTLHIYSVFFVDLSALNIGLGAALVALLCWLSVGLFIVAHDAMHGSLSPRHPQIGDWIGRLCLALYAGFSFDRLRAAHMEHHRRPGTADDPDFHVAAPRDAARWYLAFFLRYFGIRELLVLTVLVAAYTLILGAPYANLLLFWALPAILSSLQLFFFGTYLPHRHGGPFADEHNARSSGYGWLASLLSCYHFGYHHEHHCHPHVPWWRLPSLR